MAVKVVVAVAENRVIKVAVVAENQLNNLVVIYIHQDLLRQEQMIRNKINSLEDNIMMYRGRIRPKNEKLWVLLISSLAFIFGFLLVIDDLFFHFFGDLSHLDGGNPYLHHWMVGVALMLFAPFLYYKMKK